MLNCSFRRGSCDLLNRQDLTLLLKLMESSEVDSGEIALTEDDVPPPFSIDVGGKTLTVKQSKGKGTGGQVCECPRSSPRPIACFWQIWNAAVAIIDLFNGLGSAFFANKRWAVMLVRLLSIHTSRSVSVVELGSGCGISGLACAMLGARVLLTDIEYLDLARANARDNGFVCSSSTDDDERSPVRVREYAWGSDASALRPPFDAIVVADCLYNPAVYDAILRSLEQLADAHTVIYLAFEKRKQSDAAFLDKLAPRGFAHKQLLAKCTYDENDKRVHSVDQVFLANHCLLADCFMTGQSAVAVRNVDGKLVHL